ncbi:DUF4870 domain-containing protein [Stigmatella aurantiaca]|uniref:Conserved uncharacterized protein n=1 Tax=Stigmatella aurantiaca (strain DW4/3-1) TaxID=378806 RepID=Q095T7_STIAD|nr:DUF4870 domain-containing protein [Stigmatella aurantiaca]ADO72469.1 conserved uncharacterized protein [Stigmatella aurantiaca DW4/3-1]EAU67521.1 conserved hypothetical protein [Stigmatella aurantiaca DW4/3-1]
MEPQYTGSQFLTGSPVPTQDEKTWGMLAHLSALVAGIFGFPFLGPLIVMLTKGKESKWVESHAKEALNFQITATAAIWISAALMLCVVGFLLLPVIGIAALVFTIIASIKANNGEMYRYPATVRLVK